MCPEFGWGGSAQGFPNVVRTYLLALAIAALVVAPTAQAQRTGANSMKVNDTSVWKHSRGHFIFHDNRAGSNNDPVPDAWNIYGEALEFDAARVYADGRIRLDIDSKDDPDATVSSALDPTVTYVITFSSGDYAVTVVYQGDIGDVTILPDNANEVTEFHRKLAAGKAGTVVVSDELPEPPAQVVNSMEVNDLSLWKDKGRNLYVFHDNRPGASDLVPDAWNISGVPLEFDAAQVYADGRVRIDIDTRGDPNAAVSSAMDPTVTYVIRVSSGDHAVSVVYQGDIGDVTILPDNADEVIEFYDQLAEGTAGTVIVSDESVGNAAPVFKTAAAWSVAENITAVVELRASDADGDTVTFALAGGADEARFDLTVALLSFRTAPDYENHADANGDGVYEVTVNASDGRGGTASLAIRVTVTDEEEGPAAGTLRLADGASASEGRVEIYLDGQWGTVCHDDWHYEDADVACRQLGYGFGYARLWAHFGEGTGPIHLGDVDCKGEEDRLIDCPYTPTPNCTHAEDAGAVCRGVRANAAPVFATQAAQSVPENTTAVVGLEASDADGDAVTFTLAAGADQGAFELSADKLSFVEAPDFEKPGDANRDRTYEVTVRASDDRGASALLALFVEVTDVDEGSANAPPAFTTTAAQSVPENIQAVVTLEARDPNGDAVTFALGASDDKGRFQLSAALLSFRVAPDFENPGDANRDNVYEVTAQASDHRGGTTSLALFVTVTDVDERGGNAAPVFATAAAQSAAENTTAVVELLATDPDGDAVAFALAGGVDEADFELSTAQLSFREAPDYENHTDANGDGVYEVTVQASDGRGGTASLAIRVTVTDVDDGVSTPVAGALRLVDGPSPSAGRVEVYLNGEWGTVCHNYWSYRDAEVACRQAGYEGGRPRSWAAFGEGTGPIHLGDLRCTGTESRLVDCPYTPRPACTHDHDAGAVCGPNVAPVFVTKAKQSVPENTTAVVDLEASDANGDEMTFEITAGDDKAAFELWDNQLSFREAPDYEAPHDADSNGVYKVRVRASDGQGGKVALPLRVTVTDVVDEIPSPTEGSIRLADGASELEGRVEVYLRGRWGTVCDDLWDYLDARVACRQLGFSGEEARLQAHFGQGTGPIHLDNVGCRGTENRLLDCFYDSTPNCSHAEDAGVVCTDGE